MAEPIWEKGLPGTATHQNQAIGRLRKSHYNVDSNLSHDCHGFEGYREMSQANCARI